MIIFCSSICVYYKHGDPNLIHFVYFPGGTKEEYNQYFWFFAECPCSNVNDKKQISPHPSDSASGRIQTRIQTKK